MKITPPNYTQTPNDLVDHWLPHLNESELKVLLVVLRKTFGWHRQSDRISISQFIQLTGLSETSVLGAVKSLISKGLISKILVGPPGQQLAYYELVIIEDSNNIYPPSNFGGPPQQVGMTPPDTGDTKETTQYKQEIVCIGASPLKKIVCVTKRHPDGHEYQVNFEDILTKSIALRDGFKTEDFERAWEALVTTTQPIRDAYLYLVGTIKKMHNSFKTNNTGKQTCQKQPKQTKDSGNGQTSKQQSQKSSVLNLGEGTLAHHWLNLVKSGKQLGSKSTLSCLNQQTS